MTSFNDYIKLRQAKLKHKQRIVAVVSAAAFLSSTVVAVSHFLTNDLQKPSQPTATIQEPVGSELETQEKGYEIVLQREPNNRIALEGLVQTRLQMKKFQDAQKPLEVLVKLNPGYTGYKTLLIQVQKRAAEIAKP